MVVAPRAGDIDSMTTVLERLQDIIVEENQLLESGKTHNHQKFIDTKNQILRDLIVCQRSLAVPDDLLKIRDHIRTVQKLVIKNHTLLQSHVEAMSDLTAMLTDVELAEDSDGTYSKHAM